MISDYKTNKTKHIQEYLNYFILAIETSDLEQKWIFIDQLNKYKKEDLTNELKISNMIEGLHLSHMYLYRDKNIEFLDYSNFYRCKEYNMPIENIPSLKDINFEKQLSNIRNVNKIKNET